MLRKSCYFTRFLTFLEKLRPTHLATHWVIERPIH